MTREEYRLRWQFYNQSKLNSLQDVVSIYEFRKRKNSFIRKGLIKEDPKSLKIIQEGFEQFIIKTATRIRSESKNQYCLNKCPECERLTRTPYAKQCRKCGHKWHKQIAGYFQFITCFRISGRSHIYIAGEFIGNHIQRDYYLDLTNFQLNIKPQIKEIEFCLKHVNGEKKEIPALRIEIDEGQDKLIKRYLGLSSQIMILKQINKCG